MANEISQSLVPLARYTTRRGETYYGIWLIVIIDVLLGQLHTELFHRSDECRLDTLILIKPLDSLADEFKIHALVIFGVE